MDPFRLTAPEPDLLRFGPKCCQECFHHHWLRDFVQRKSMEVGECEFCGENDVPLIHVGILYPQFINLLSMYEPVNQQVASKEFLTSKSLAIPLRAHGELIHYFCLPVRLKLTTSGGQENKFKKERLA